MLVLLFVAVFADVVNGGGDGCGGGVAAAPTVGAVGGVAAAVVALGCYYSKVSGFLTLPRLRTLVRGCKQDGPPATFVKP